MVGSRSTGKKHASAASSPARALHAALEGAHAMNATVMVCPLGSRPGSPSKRNTNKGADVLADILARVSRFYSRHTLFTAQTTTTQHIETKYAAAYVRSRRIERNIVANLNYSFHQDILKRRPYLDSACKVPNGVGK